MGNDNKPRVVKEHDPSVCAVCMELGDFTTETDTHEWLEEHRKVVDLKLRIEWLPERQTNIVVEEEA